MGAYGNFLASSGLQAGHRLLLWSENRPEWIFVFWGALTRGIQVVPVDPGSSVDFVNRVARQAACRLILLGQDVPDPACDIPILRLPDPSQLRKATPSPGSARPEDIAEIIFTSGATGNPKGVVHRHQSLSANLGAFETEFHRYRHLAAPFQPIRTLCLLPLSHLFGQVMSLFIPPLLGGSVVLAHSLTPAHIVEILKSERVSVLVTVPRLLEQVTSFLELDRQSRDVRIHFHGIAGVAERWWQTRALHRRLGWKFWSIVAGGAALSRELEDAWSRIGILVIQGYGLTEAGPVISVNHPFHARHGSLGQVLGGQELRLADNGEIEVRGANVSREYLEDGEIRRADLDQDWLPTGDVGELDASGNLYFKGRRKEVIVTAAGLNVFPEDVEAVLVDDPSVREAAVVGIDAGRGETVHAVLVLSDAAADPESIIRRANLRLEHHQRIEGWSIWAGDALPRTPSTLKLRRHEIRARIESGGNTGSPASVLRPAEKILQRLSGRAAGRIGQDDRLDEDLGLSSLDRVELLQDLEGLTGRRLDELEFSRLQSVGEVEAWLQGSATSPQRGDGGGQTIAASRLSMPSWATRLPVRIVRSVVRRALILPLLRHYLPLTVQGSEQVERLGKASVILAANHQSHLDTVALLAALPPSWRARIAPAVRMERFAAYFSPRGRPLSERLSALTQYLLACVLFNTYPLPQSGVGLREVLQYTGRLLDAGYCPLVFPEGRRTEDGAIHEFHPGIGLMARELGVPILPVRVEGLFDVLPVTRSWPTPRPVRISFGELLRPAAADSPEEIARELKARITGLGGPRSEN